MADMTREEAAREIDNTACCFSDKRFRDAMHMAADALRGPQPDPITGLVPCGCEYCNGTNEQKPLFHENNYSPYTRMESCITVSESMDGKRYLIDVDLWDGANACAAFEINYCPMCGRKLEVEG